jgi:MFS family permease
VALTLTAEAVAATPPSGAVPLPLRRQGDFMRLWGGQTVSQLGSAVTDLALPTLAVLQLDAGASQVGLLVACGRLPFPLLGLPVGTLLDRVRRRPAMIAADVGRCALLALIPLLSALGMLQLWVLYLVALGVGSLTVVFDVAYMAYVPELVGTDQLAAANTRLELSRSAATIGGPGLGGILLQVVGAARAILADAASFAVSAVSLLAIRRREPEPPAAPSVHRRMRAEVAEGVRHVLGHPILRSLLLTTTGMVFFAHMAETALLLFAYLVLHLSPGELGVVITTIGAGAVMGALAARPVGRALGVGHAMAVSTALGGVLLGLMPLALVLPAMPTLIALGLLMGAQDTVFNIHQLTLRQALTPDRLRGRMTAVFRTAYWGAWPLGNVVGGLLAGLVGPAAVVAAGGVGSAGAGAALLFTPAGRIRALPRAAPELRVVAAGAAAVP